jgi:hypothetical protein
MPAQIPISGRYAKRSQSGRSGVTVVMIQRSLVSWFVSRRSLAAAGARAYRPSLVAMDKEVAPSGLIPTVPSGLIGQYRLSE